MIVRTIVGQFENPRGPLGALIGTIMANRPSNRERNRWTVGLLELGPHERVLEIGCGPGFALSLLAELTDGGVVGLDHSATMLAQASRRNAVALAAGRLTLVHAGLEALPTLTGPFDAVLAVNVVQFWEDVPAAFRAIRALLSPSGRFAVTYQPRTPGSTGADAHSAADRTTDALLDAGFARAERFVLPLRPVPAVAVRATVV
jgi:cyclopropane fatty-acyl-phospholipid synthase-like methyltransferase